MLSPMWVSWFTATLAIASAGVIPRGHGFAIVGGVPAKITELPHQVYLTDKSWGLFCGGSIISRSHILTAAHCAEGNEADDIEVVLGTDNRTAGNGQVFKVAKITIHENFTTRHAPFESLNDIAVLTLAEKIKLSKKAKIIPLAKPKHQVKGGTELVASGWGMTAKPYGDSSDILRKVTVPKVDFDDCYRAHKDDGAIVNENEICAGGQSGKGVFRGDSGGALIEKTKKGNLQVGIASWVHPDDDKPGFPDVYTQVLKYYNWIKKVLKKDLDTEIDLILSLEDDFDF